MNVIQLQGCRFEPLMNYLKALGVLRSVALQKDDTAKGFWKRSNFVLRSKLSAEDLVDFFLGEYEPSPVFSPWNKGSGFFPRGRETKAVEVIESLRNCEENRLRGLRNTIRRIDDAIEKVTGKKPKDVDDKTIEKCKSELMAYLRNNLPDEIIDWLDVVYAMTLNTKFNYQTAFAIIMGSGGNDGNLEFSVNFLESICDVFDMMEKERTKVHSALKKSIFDVGEEPPAKKNAIGFFNPGGVGGPNATEGFEGESLSNPWDYILMIEGVLLLAGSVNRRLGRERESMGDVAAFPFSVAPVYGGANVISSAEGSSQSARGEVWMPLWEKPMSLAELKWLFSEGRASLGKRTAADGLEFARSVATLGVSRGIKGFVRYGIYKRSGKSYLAVPLAILPVREEKLKGADLLSDIDNWLKKSRNLATNKDVPIGVREMPRLVYDCIFKYLEKGDVTSFQRLVICLGKAEMVLSRVAGGKEGRSETKAEPAKKDKNRKIMPDPLNLHRVWAEIADDGTPEFRIARALAGIGWAETSFSPVRRDIHPVDVEKKKHGGHRASWSDKARKTVPYVENPVRFLTSILEKRCIAGKKEERDLVPIDSVFNVSLNDVQRFLDGSLDYRKMVDLFLGLILVNDPKPLRASLGQEQKTIDKAFGLSRDYILLKSCYLPEPLFFEGEKRAIPYDLKIMGLLRARRTSDACSLASRKLRANGITPVSSFGRDGVDPLLLCASLLIPVDIYEFTNRALPLLRKRELVRIH